MARPPRLNYNNLALEDPNDVALEEPPNPIPLPSSGKREESKYKKLRRRGVLYWGREQNPDEIALRSELVGSNKSDSGDQKFAISDFALFTDKNKMDEALLEVVDAAEDALNSGVSLQEMKQAIKNLTAKAQEAADATTKRVKAKPRAKKQPTLLGERVPAVPKTKRYKQDAFPIALLKDQAEFKKAQSYVNNYNYRKRQGEVLSAKETELFLRCNRFMGQALTHQSRPKPTQAKPTPSGASHIPR